MIYLDILTDDFWKRLGLWLKVISIVKIIVAIGVFESKLAVSTFKVILWIESNLENQWIKSFYPKLIFQWLPLPLSCFQFLSLSMKVIKPRKYHFSEIHSTSNFLNGNINDWCRANPNKTKADRQYFFWNTACSIKVTCAFWRHSIISLSRTAIWSWDRDLTGPVGRFEVCIFCFHLCNQKNKSIHSKCVALINNYQCSPVVPDYFEDSFTIDPKT